MGSGIGTPRTMLHIWMSDFSPVRLSMEFGDDLPQVPQSPALATCPLSSVACGVLCGVSGVSNALWLWGK